MLSKEDLLMRVQQGIIDPNWTVARPKSAYFLGQIVLWLILTLIPIGAAFYYMSMPNHALVLSGASIDSNAALQTWRMVDFIVFGLLALAFLRMLVIQILELLAIGRQLLVITPEGVFMGLRNKEYFVTYANVTSIVPNVQRSGTVKLIIRANTGQTTLHLDKRFGQSKALASQIVMAQRQLTTPSKG